QLAECSFWKGEVAGSSPAPLTILSVQKIKVWVADSARRERCSRSNRFPRRMRKHIGELNGLFRSYLVRWVAKGQRILYSCMRNIKMKMKSVAFFTNPNEIEELAIQ